jgi:serine protease
MFSCFRLRRPQNNPSPFRQSEPGANAKCQVLNKESAVRFTVTAAVALLAATTVVHAQTTGPSQEYNGDFGRNRSLDPPSTDRIIVKWRGPQAKSATAAARAQKATSAAGMSMRKQQSVTDDMDVMLAPQELSGSELNDLIQRLQADPAVEYASPDLRRHAHALTSDPQLSTVPGQWYLLSDQPAATRAHLAWDTTHGSSSIVVAVLDTGVRFEHPDLGSVDTGGKLLKGYDFVSNTLVANDSDGRDADASDPGDWVTQTDLQNPAFSDCDAGDSSWHGTRVSGLIGALTDNGVGVAGAAWDTRILPVRVLGKCGGFDSDIIAGMLWAAGLPVSGVPANTTPAKIINLSLGGVGVCSTAYQNAVNQVTAQGVLVVASAGNDGGPVAAPANCNGVLGVAAIRHIGTKVGFSSLGTEVGISAPGGNCVLTNSCQFPIIVATNDGTTTPTTSSYTDSTLGNVNVGTSFSAPLAAAAAALVEALDPTLTPAKVVNLLKESATTFPTSSTTTGVTNCRVPTSATDTQDSECICTTRTCGAGMLNTNAAVLAVQNPLAVFSNTGTLNVGSSVALDGGASFAPTGRTVTAYQWSLTNVVGTAPTFTTPTQSTTSLQITDSGSFTVRLTITDSSGAQDTKDVPLATTVSSTPTNPPTFSNGGGGGGGGSLGWELLALALLAGRRITRRYKA